MENPEIKIDYNAQFEQHYEQDILPFVKKKGHASCFEWMKEFHISYPESVRIMDALEERDIVDAAELGVSGPRPLLNGKKKRCPPTSVTNATPTSTLSKESESIVETVVLPAATNAVAKPSTTTTRKRTAVRKAVKRR